MPRLAKCLNQETLGIRNIPLHPCLPASISKESFFHRKKVKLFCSEKRETNYPLQIVIQMTRSNPAFARLQTTIISMLSASGEIRHEDAHRSTMTCLFHLRGSNYSCLSYLRAAHSIMYPNYTVHECKFSSISLRDGWREMNFLFLPILEFLSRPIKCICKNPIL